MRVVILSLCFFVFLLTGSTQATDDVNSPKYLELQELVLSRLRPYRDVYTTWIPALVSSPDTPTNYNEKQSRADLTCDACHAGLDVLKLLRNPTVNVPPETISALVVGACTILEIVKPDVCEGAVTSYTKPVLQIIEDKKDLTTHDFCGILLPGCGFINPSLTNWTIDIDPNIPAVGPPAPPLPDNVPRAQILQFTDIHLDLDYKVGSNAECGRPAGCCRDFYSDVPDPTLPEMTAGPYGHFKCSLPETALDAIFAHAKTTHPDPKYIFLTGDFIHSAIWLYNEAENTRHLENVTRKLADVFPNVPIFPVVGNHEPDVVNMFHPNELWEKGFDLSWMYKIVSEPFLAFIGDGIENFMKGGYYAVRPDPAVPFRLVVLNTNLCYLQNFWLVYKTDDPTGQLQWFANTMLAAERAGETVHILGHIQPGSGSCWTVWSDKFDRIVKRFHPIIKAQYYGHNHREYFALSFDDADNPISVEYMGPSGVTDNGHSAYKLYEVDGVRPEATWEIIDHKTYILNLTASNVASQAVMQELFSANSMFGLKSQRPVDLYDFVTRMVTDKELFKTFLSAHRKGAPENYGPCEDDECRGNALCDLVITNSGVTTPCRKIKELIRLAGTTTTRPSPNSAFGLKFSSAVLTLIAVLAFIFRH